MKRVKVKLKDIHIEKDSIHYAKWVVKDTFQCWIGKEELYKIVNAKERGHTLSKKLYYKPSKT